MLDVLVESVVVDRATHVLPPQVEQPRVVDVFCQLRIQNVVVNARIVALHVGTEDELVFR